MRSTRTWKNESTINLAGLLLSAGSLSFLFRPISNTVFAGALVESMWLAHVFWGTRLLLAATIAFLWYGKVYLGKRIPGAFAKMVRRHSTGRLRWGAWYARSARYQKRKRELITLGVGRSMRHSSRRTLSTEP